MKIELNVGDIIYSGKFKNKRTEIKSFGTDDKGQPTYNNGKKILNFRVEKFMKEDLDKQIKLSEILLKEYRGDNFIEERLKLFLELEKEIKEVEKEIKKNKFEKTSIDRYMKYVNEFLEKTKKYFTLASEALEDMIY